MIYDIDNCSGDFGIDFDSFSDYDSETVVYDDIDTDTPVAPRAAKAPKTIKPVAPVFTAHAIVEQPIDQASEAHLSVTIDADDVAHFDGSLGADFVATAYDREILEVLGFVGKINRARAKFLAKAEIMGQSSFDF